MLNIENLSVAERLELLETVWDSLSQTPSVIELTEPQKRELDSRLDALDADLEHGPEPLGIPWDQVMRPIEAGY